MNWGVMGVATATVISRIINLIIVATMGAVLIKAKDSPERIAPGKIPRTDYKDWLPVCL